MKKITILFAIFLFTNQALGETYPEFLKALLPADAIYQAELSKTKTVQDEVILKKIEGKNFVESASYQDNKTKKIVSLRIDGIFVEIGSQPATSFVKGLVDSDK